MFSACADARADIIFILDSSTSVSEPNFKKMLNFVKNFLASAQLEQDIVRIGAVTYSTDVHVRFNLNTYKTRSDILNAIDAIPYTYGSTNTAGAITMMRTNMYRSHNGDRPDVPNIAIVITDGVSNVNSRKTLPEAEAARQEGIHIYAIGIGLTDTRELDGIASKPIDLNRFVVSGFDELRGLPQQVFSQFCSGGSHIHACHMYIVYVFCVCIIRCAFKINTI